MYDEHDAEVVQSLLERLLNLESELTEEMSNLRGAARPVELDQQAFGRVSRGDAQQQQNMAQANLQLCEARMRLVKHALNKIEDPANYGYCESCDEPITLARLKARPESPHCVRCQEKSEHK